MSAKPTGAWTCPPNPLGIVTLFTFQKTHGDAVRFERNEKLSVVDCPTWIKRWAVRLEIRTSVGRAAKSFHAGTSSTLDSDTGLGPVQVDAGR